MRRLVVLSALLLPFSAMALDTLRFGSRVLAVGDSSAKLIELAGQPAIKDPIETKEGGREGERWQYSRDGKTLTVVIKNGKVESIDESR
ncbi:DUF2845 domain-containing protein [Tahibacter amnicola]|uniref:DUF2845 domain-containing protein n=1 Tax=Tahibacter amnicola TaxID=2976241 RepID=A0ABY6BGE5_9GAMM|nr:DUF2845 domain-containing protein [Tahibacter amnicola]UXI68852.1 DUF2845 domain-containing protein [Tahibacter amnicola]